MESAQNNYKNRKYRLKLSRYLIGTNYCPLDNEFQIREALEDTCVLINRKVNVFEHTSRN